MPWENLEHRFFVAWAADCAEHVLNLFEKEYPNDKRPRNAVMEARNWIRTGKFSMKIIRKAALDSHAAARKAPENSAARAAARSAGQAVAAAHVREHASAAANYALAAAEIAEIKGEMTWQSKKLKKKIRNKLWKIDMSPNSFHGKM